MWFRYWNIKTICLFCFASISLISEIRSQTAYLVFSVASDVKCNLGVYNEAGARVHGFTNSSGFDLNVEPGSYTITIQKSYDKVPFDVFEDVIKIKLQEGVDQQVRYNFSNKPVFRDLIINADQSNLSVKLKSKSGKELFTLDSPGRLTTHNKEYYVEWFDGESRREELVDMKNNKGATVFLPVKKPMVSRIETPYNEYDNEKRQYLNRNYREQDETKVVPKYGPAGQFFGGLMIGSLWAGLGVLVGQAKPESKDSDGNPRSAKEMAEIKSGYQAAGWVLVALGVGSFIKYMSEDPPTEVVKDEDTVQHNKKNRDRVLREFEDYYAKILENRRIKNSQIEAENEKIRRYNNQTSFSLLYK